MSVCVLCGGRITGPYYVLERKRETEKEDEDEDR